MLNILKNRELFSPLHLQHRALAALNLVADAIDALPKIEETMTNTFAASTLQSNVSTTNRNVQNQP
jgi:hypothetical protein